MSEYGDEYSDYGEEWFYVEEEFVAADDLAEHAVASPPPTTYADEDAAEDWDRFDYFNDLEYASDGYDDAVFEVHDAKNAQGGEKRKRHIKPSQSKKRQRTLGATEAAALDMSPIVWRSQVDRGRRPKLLDDDAQTYTVLHDWRKKLKDTPHWAQASPPQSPTVQATRGQKRTAEVASTAEPASPPLDLDAEDEGAHEDEMDIDPAALMAALQSRLAEAGGPLSGMDPQQLLEFAMRMATGKDAGDDIAGEMADAMFNQGDEDDEDDTEKEANLLSWVAQQRNSGADLDTNLSCPTTASGTKRSPTPSDGNTVARPSQKSGRASQTGPSSRPHTNKSSKRKACEDEEVEASGKPAKKRATRTFDAPTAASQAKTASAKTTRSGRKR